MLRKAEILAKERGCQFLVTGENLAQVSSQTLSNLVTIDRSVSIPVFRPLLGFDKVEIVKIAEKIGKKERVNVITGAQAAAVVNKLHSSKVATGGDVIAEYGRDPKDLLYISKYTEAEKAKNAFDAMIIKMRNARGGPFTHLVPIKKYGDKVFMALGMGAVHYIIWSEEHLLWLQTYQPFGTTLPTRILALYPVR